MKKLKYLFVAVAFIGYYYSIHKIFIR